MDRYTPPYEINDKMLMLLTSISEKIGNLEGRNTFDIKPHLRKNSTIRSIHSSLKIEANSLSISKVRDVISGIPVYGDEKEIIEVKNAYECYTQIDSLNPYSLTDFLKAHGIMAKDLVNDSGEFRKGNEGVFSNETCIFVAPPPEIVPELMQKLFAWINEVKAVVHPLIISSVFHYEMVFIHPFTDGNGRMARLWQTLILSNWKESFKLIPIETEIEKYQEEYYSAISKSHIDGNSNAFIEFMLTMIDKSLDSIKEDLYDFSFDYTPMVRETIGVMEYDIQYSANEIMEKLGLKSKETFRKNYIDPAIELGLVEKTIPDKPTSKNQRYVKK